MGVTICSSIALWSSIVACEFYYVFIDSRVSKVLQVRMASQAQMGQM